MSESISLESPKPKRPRPLWMAVSVVVLGLVATYVLVSYITLPELWKRYAKRHPALEDLPDEKDLNTLLIRVGFRLHSRLREMCDFLEYDGPDFRNPPPNAGADDLYMQWKAQPRRKLPARTQGQARSQLKAPKHDKTDLKWSGGRAGS